ncbi:MAG TPA: TetR/AcrR family transcriptional regulator [Bacteroidales bacterium]|nr:TetR/AcrR family transcriptional regulator [Bacteroidales bacterium]
MDKELQNILERVGALYSKYGIKSVTMDDVARELGMSKKTLYQYVENKNDLVEKVLDYLLFERECEFLEIFEKNYNAIEELITVGIQVIKSIKYQNPATEYDLQKYYPVLFNKLQNIRKERMYNATLKNIQKGKQEGLFRKELNEEIIAKIQTSRFLNFSADEFFDPQEMLKPENILELFIYHIRGIANQKGIEELDKTLKTIDIQEFLI